ncbi:ribbon-helix-helix domain-containing protein [Parvularcula lutaonensis]|uniref:Ribbon-helix-helix domain-containing protein n=1 Tax=Parvularcula lutaonensis TaxID=491923 RepID=A0ABV7MFP8_9PROT
MTETDLARFQKRSVSLSGHRTSVSLERAFWAVLEAAAKRRDLSLAGLIGEIDRARAEDQNLASALRLFALKEAQGRHAH